MTPTLQTSTFEEIFGGFLPTTKHSGGKYLHNTKKNNNKYTHTTLVTITFKKEI